MPLHILGITQEGCHTGHVTADTLLIHLSQDSILTDALCELTVVQARPPGIPRDKDLPH